MKRQKIKNALFYFFLVFFVFLSISATYVNIIVKKNFKQFTADENEPRALDFYIHPSSI